MESGFGVIINMCILEEGGSGRHIAEPGGYRAIGNFTTAGEDGFGYQGIGTEDNFSLTF
jgi:hypothetical protein